MMTETVSDDEDLSSGNTTGTQENTIEQQL